MKPELLVVGIGGKRAEVKVRSRLASGQRPPAALLMLGFAGAIDPTLETGDLVLASRYYRADSVENPHHAAVAKGDLPAPPFAKGGNGGGYLTPDPAMLSWAVDAAGDMGQPVAHVDSLTVDDPVTTPAAKRSLARGYPVGIVDMEDHWVAAIAREAGVPFLSARVVLDPADQALPGYLPGLARSRIKAVLGTAAMPWRIPALAGLARQLPSAQRVLTRFALNFLARAANGDPAHPYPAASSGIRNGLDWSVLR